MFSFRMSLLQGYNSMHKFDIICLSQTYLPGYNLIRADNPSNIKRGRYYIYIEKSYQ